MKVVEVKFSPWDRTYDFDMKDCELEKGDKVIVQTEFGMEIATVVNIKKFSKQDLAEVEAEGREIKPVIRKANLTDIEKEAERNLGKEEAITECEKIITKLELPMKLIDARFSFDGGKIIFAFTSKVRVDFRDLVKELTHRFQKSIRLQQVNVREEVRASGDVGSCGKELCCKSFLGELGNINLEKAQNQQIIHWGVERLSGVCGRLKCCLDYEDAMYQELSKNLPEIGRRVRTDSGSGEVISWNILKQSVMVRLDQDKDDDGRPTVIEVPIKKK